MNAWGWYDRHVNAPLTNAVKVVAAFFGRHPVLAVPLLFVYFMLLFRIT